MAVSRLVLAACILACIAVPRGAAGLKQDWCDIEASVVSGTVAATQALAGRNVTCGMVEYPPFSSYNASLDQWYGHDVEVLQEIAARGGFTVEYFKLPNLAPGQTYTGLLEANKETVDIMCTWWGETAGRKDLGWSYTGAIVDASLIVATQIKTTDETFSQVFWTFLEPFKADLWALVVAGIVGSGFYLYWLDPTLAHDVLEIDEEDEGGMPAPVSEKLYNMVCRGWFMFALQENYVPSTPWSRLYLVSWSTVILVIISAYTAQLTTFLIVEKSSSGLVAGLEDLVVQNRMVCKPAGVDWVNAFFRQQAPTLRTTGLSITNHFEAIRGGTCAGAVMGLSELQLLLAENNDCDMTIVGRSLNTVSGSYLAHWEKCGTALSSAVDALLQTLQEDGTKDLIWDRYTATPPACMETTEALDTASLALSAKTVGGLFIIHGCVAVVAGIGRLIAPRGFRRPRPSGGVGGAPRAGVLGADPTSSRRVLVRLASNQVRASPTGSPMHGHHGGAHFDHPAPGGRPGSDEKGEKPQNGATSHTKVMPFGDPSHA